MEKIYTQIEELMKDNNIIIKNGLLYAEPKQDKVLDMSEEINYEKLYKDLLDYHMEYAKNTWVIIGTLQNAIEDERKEVQRLIEILNCRRD